MIPCLLVRAEVLIKNAKESEFDCTVTDPVQQFKVTPFRCDCIISDLTIFKPLGSVHMQSYGVNVMSIHTCSFLPQDQLTPEHPVVGKMTDVA